ncbi:MAG: hypothetical protein WD469_00875 [Paenibacillaceae bacterium]
MSKFNDNANVSNWAAADTAKVTEAGIMQGNADRAPQIHLTLCLIPSFY